MQFGIIIALCVLSMISAWVMVVAEYKENHLAAYLSKCIGSVCFVAAGFIAALGSETSKNIILLLLGGLVLGMLGDIFLCRTHIAREEFWTPILNVGGGFFLVGHLCYFAAFILMGGISRVWIYVLVPVLLMLVFFLIRTGRWSIGRKDWLGYLFYALVSGLMLSSGIEIMLIDPVPGRDILAAAAVVFIFSDITLATWAYGRFHNVKMRFTCITAYYAAQILFVLGICFV